MNREHVEVGKAIQKRTGKTFHLATRFLPRRVRHPTYVLYAFFRIADEVVDGDETPPPAEQRARLESLRAQALGEAKPEGPVLEAFQEVCERYDVPDTEVAAFVDAMLADVDTDRYETREDLEAYTRGSAAAVGVMMTAIMEPDDPEAARPHAVALGEAFQLTNFLRDVREDVVDHGRIYLPLATLRAHGVEPGQVERLEMSESFAAAMADLLAYTEAYYREGVAGIRYLPADCRFPVLLAAVLYAEHHRLVRDRGYDVLSATPALSTTRKLRCVVRTWWHWRARRDPEAVFRRVSAVPTLDPGTGQGAPGPGERVSTR